MTRVQALKLIEEAISYLIQQKYAYAAALYETGAVPDEWAQAAHVKRAQLLAALETVKEPERLLF